MEINDYVQLPNGQHGQIVKIPLYSLFSDDVKLIIMSYGEYEIGKILHAKSSELKLLKEVPNPILFDKELCYRFKGSLVKFNIVTDRLFVDGTYIGHAKLSPYGPILFEVRNKMKGLI